MEGDRGTSNRWLLSLWTVECVNSDIKGIISYVFERVVLCIPSNPHRVLSSASTVVNPISAIHIDSLSFRTDYLMWLPKVSWLRINFSIMDYSLLYRPASELLRKALSKSKGGKCTSLLAMRNCNEPFWEAFTLQEEL